MPAQTRIYQNARARLRIGLCATLFRPTDSARIDRTKLPSFLPLKNTMQQETTQEQLGAGKRAGRGERGGVGAASSPK